MATLYEFLSVAPNASAQEIRIAFKRRALAVHPDKKGGTKEAFQSVLRAFETLSDTSARKLYDARMELSRRSKFAGAQRRRGEPQQGERFVRREPKAHATETKRQSSPKRQFATAKRQKLSAGRPRTTWKTGCARRMADPGDVAGFPKGKANHRKPRNPLLSGSTPGCYRRIAYICELLSLLSQAWRRIVIKTRFSQKQRLQMEEWLVLRKSSVGETGWYPKPMLVCGTPSTNSPSSPQGSESDGFISVDGSQGYSPYLQICDMQESPDSCIHISDDDSSTDGGNAQGAAFTAVMGDVDGHEVGADDQSPPSNGECPQRIRGISRMRCRGKCWYGASVCIDCLRIRSRYTCDLNRVLDYLVVLTSVKLFVQSREGPIISRVQSALQEAFLEHGVTAEELGINFVALYQVKWWWLPQVQFSSPVFHDLEHVTRMKLAMAEFTSNSQSRLSILDRWRRLQSFPEEWPRFAALYRSFSGRYAKRVVWDKRLRDIAEQGEPERERQAMLTEEMFQRKRNMYSVRGLTEEERWNLRQMRMEERRQVRHQKIERKRCRRAERGERFRMCAEERRQRRLNIADARSMQREIRSMEKQDRQSRRLNDPALLKSITQALLEWRRVDTYWKRKERIRVRNALKKARAIARNARKQQKRERAARWIWLKRRDLTMNDILLIRL